MNARVHCPARTQIFRFWVDAKHRASTVAILHGYSVIVMHYDDFEVIYGESLTDCLDRAEGRVLQAEFNEHGVQTT